MKSILACCIAIGCLLLSATTGLALQLSQPGWHMISPLATADLDSWLKDHPEVLSLWGWNNNQWEVLFNQADPPEHDFATLSQTKDYQGYWVRTTSAVTIPDSTASSRTSLESYQLEPNSGWHLLGTPAAISDVHTFAFDALELGNTLWHFDGTQWKIFHKGVYSGIFSSLARLESLPADSAFWVNTSGTPPSFVTFESGQVRPLALSVDQTRLYAVNTPDNHLEIYLITESGLQHEHSVPVGLEPVAVAAHANGQVWVVNHLSDSVSVVDSTLTPPRTVQTIRVGDEPRDVVFAGQQQSRAFITTAHRGQHSGVNDDYLTPGVGRADVWVFKVNETAATHPSQVAVVNLFGDVPRALAVSNDGSKVYAAIFHSGNQTTTLGDDNFTKATPTTDINGVHEPDTGLIVKYNGISWVDESGADFSAKVRFNLPDYDVFEIDASAETPTVVQRHAGVGTTLFNLAVNPQTGTLYVSNTEALNHIRFEGFGEVTDTVRGHFTENRLTVIKDGEVLSRHLNKHIDYSQFVGTAEVREKSLSLPLGMQVDAAGETLYLAAMGSNKVAALNVAQVEADEFIPATADHITLSGGGPTGLVLDEARKRLYALTRYNNGIAIVDLESKTEIGSVEMHNPEPVGVVSGRPFLYDANLTSSHGDSSCALCHVFGDMDHLAWDLGNPDKEVADSPNEYVSVLPIRNPEFHPLKGPMTTQSFRGMARNGPLHWRGDRTGSDRFAGESLEAAAFREFNNAFTELIGREETLSDSQMVKFTDFVMQMSYPPNPYRNLDNSDTADQSAGRNVYMNQNTTVGFIRCTQCHVLDEERGHFGTSGLMSFENESQDFKVPHLRNLYQKLGKFGFTGSIANGDTSFMGDQVRGFGFIHDGAIDTPDSFLQTFLFSFSSDAQRLQVVDFLVSFPSELAPIVGQQATLGLEQDQESQDLVELMIQRALVSDPWPECELVVHGVIAGQATAWLMQTDGLFQPDKSSEVSVSFTELTALMTENSSSLTFTSVPPGSGYRMALDRDQDGILNRDAP